MIGQVQRVALAAVFTLAPALASAQLEKAKDQKRPFDFTSGIVFVCQPSPTVTWTQDGCAHLLAEVKRRAAAAHVAMSVKPYASDMSSKKLGVIDGFDGDKAIRMRWTFLESSSVPGRVHVDVGSNTIWEPTPQEIPNVAPGQRIHRNFFSTGIQFEPGAKVADAEPYMKVVPDAFFECGQRKL